MDDLIRRDQVMDCINELWRRGEFTPENVAMSINALCDVDAVMLPPVKMGDTAFFVINGNVFEGKVYFIRWEHHKECGIHSDISASFSPYTTIGASFDDFGKTVFLTREEAEAALAKMKG
jgi:hypothetical protein